MNIEVGDRVFVTRRTEASNNFSIVEPDGSLVLKSKPGEFYRDLEFDGIVRDVRGELLLLECNVGRNKSGKMICDVASVNSRYVTRVEKNKEAA